MDIIANNPINLSANNNSLNFNSKNNFYSESPLSIGSCLAYFNFNESGTYVYDNYSTYSGIVLGSITFDNGRLSSGLFMNPLTDMSTNYSISFGNPTGLQFTYQNPFSYSCWVYPLGSAIGSFFAADQTWHKYTGMGIIGRNFNSCLDMSNTGPAFRAGVRYPGSSLQTTIAGPNITFNRWYHVALTFDAGSQILYLYQNGVLVKSGLTNLVPFTNTTNFSIGNPICNGDGRGFYGYLDEAGVFNKTLSAFEVKKLYNLGYFQRSNFYSEGQKNLYCTNNNLVIREV